MNHSRASDVQAVVGAILAVLLGVGDAQALNCYQDILVGAHDMERGFFVDSARKTALSLRPSPCSYTDDAECDHKCLLQHEDGPIAKIERFDYASTHGVCRDPVTGLDHVLIHQTSGKYHEVQFWSVGPAGEEVKPEYEEAWSDFGDGLTIENRALLVDADGRCLWRGRQQARAAFQKGLSTLRVGQDATPLLLEGNTTTLPVREISAEVVRQQLLALDAMQPRIVEFGTAIYADEAGRTAWRIIQVTGTVFYDAPGVVLVENRGTGTWHALYDVISGGSYRLNFPAQFVIVTGNTLTAELCIDCSFWGEYGCFEIDLPTSSVKSLNGSVCREMQKLHYPDWNGCDPIDEEERFDLRKELGVD